MSQRTGPPACRCGGASLRWHRRRQGRFFGTLLLGVLLTSAAQADPPKARAAAAAAAAASDAEPAASAVKRRAALLVTGRGQAVSQAHVLLRAADGSEQTAFTDARGEVSFAVPGAASYSVRVIAKGWATFEQDFTLAGGTRTEVRLKAKPPPT